MCERASGRRNWRGAPPATARVLNPCRHPVFPGDQDKVAPFENASVIKELCPGAKLVVLAGCGHADNFGVKYHVMRGAITDFLAGK